MIIIVCGVSGTGKSTIGKLLARKLELTFHDADDFHPPHNVQKMASGKPLNDADRQPWLAQLAKNLPEWDDAGGAVLACSALKESYRQILASNAAIDVQWIMLTGSQEILTQRISSRQNHFFAPALLRSQLDVLELPEYGLLLDVKESPDSIVNSILQRLFERY